MRDLLIVSIALVLSVVALRRPWVGVMLWTWISIMNPHRYAWGFAYNAPLGTMAAAATLTGLLMTRDRESPFKGTPVTALALFMGWMTLSWLMGMDPAGDLPQWVKVMKIDVMILVALALLRSKAQIIALAWVAGGSIAMIGAKGGLFTLLTGGAHRVWGPAGSFIADNNAFALAVVMTIPLVRFLQLQLQRPLARHAMTGVMVLLAASALARHAMTVVMVLLAAAALGSHSRGGLLAILSMVTVLWLRGRRKFGAGIVIVAGMAALIAFMPAEWTARMDTIETYDQDKSALGRFSAWWTAWNLAFRYPFGVGFEAARAELFIQFSPYGLAFGTPAAHSIYFQVLGNHGFVGLALFLAIWISTWRAAGRIRKAVKDIPQARWCGDLAGMCQVSLVGYAAGGTFLSLAYFDLPYNVMVLVVLTAAYVRRKGWETDPVYRPTSRWLTIPGVQSLPPPQAPSALRPAR